MGSRTAWQARGARALFGCAGAWFFAACAGASLPEAHYPSSPAGPLEVNVAERTLVVALRPGDETVSSSGLVQRVIRRVGSVSTLLVSAGEGDDGPSRAKLRLREARVAGRISSRGAGRLQVLGFSAAQLAAFGCGPEFQGALPDVACGSRTDAARSDARLSALARALRESLVRTLREMPTLVVFPDVHEGPPDQRALGAITLLALREHMRGRNTPWPRTLAYVAAPRAWPRAPEPLPNDVAPRSRLCLPLSDQERARKREALATYASQRRVLPAFARDEECFMESTLYDVEFVALHIEQPGVSALNREQVRSP
jgi:LmbE family N-acetylglucosaminyl deacetylase